MQVSSTTPRQVAVLPYRANVASAQTDAPQQSNDQVTLSSKDGVGWGDAAVGLVGAAAGAVIETAGNTVGSVYHSIKGTGEAYRSLWKTQALGPVVKTSIAALLPVATVAVPVLTAIGSAFFGMYRGFTSGIKDGLGGAISAAAKDVKEFNTEVADGAHRAINEFADAKPEDGKEPFDISPVRGVAGAVAGVGNAVVGGLGIGVSTLSQLPEAFLTANKAISKSKWGLPLKTVTHAVSLPLAVVAAPLGFVGGALFGLGSGAYHGYKDGFGESFSKTGDYVKQYHKSVDEGLAKLAESLVND